MDNDTLQRVLETRGDGRSGAHRRLARAGRQRDTETIINKSEKVKGLKTRPRKDDLTAKQKATLTDAEKEFKPKRKLVQEKLIKFATRIPAFMYLTDFARTPAGTSSPSWSQNYF